MGRRGPPRRVRQLSWHPEALSACLLDYIFWRVRLGEKPPDFAELGLASRERRDFRLGYRIPPPLMWFALEEALRRYNPLLTDRLFESDAIFAIGCSLNAMVDHTNDPEAWTRRRNGGDRVRVPEIAERFDAGEPVTAVEMVSLPHYLNDACARTGTPSPRGVRVARRIAEYAAHHPTRLVERAIAREGLRNITNAYIVNALLDEDYASDYPFGSCPCTLASGLTIATQGITESRLRSRATDRLEEVIRDAYHEHPEVAEAATAGHWREPDGTNSVRVALSEAIHESPPHFHSVAQDLSRIMPNDPVLSSLSASEGDPDDDEEAVASLIIIDRDDQEVSQQPIPKFLLRCALLGKSSRQRRSAADFMDWIGIDPTPKAMELFALRGGSERLHTNILALAARFPDPAYEPRLRHTAQHSRSEHIRLRSVWGLRSLGRGAAWMVDAFRDETSSAVRSAYVSNSGTYLAETPSADGAEHAVAILALAHEDPDHRVQQQALAGWQRFRTNLHQGSQRGHR